MKNDKKELIDFIKYSLGVVEKEYYQTCYEIHLWDHDIGFNPIEGTPVKALESLLRLSSEDKKVFDFNIMFFNKTHEYLQYKKLQTKSYKDCLFDLLKKLISDKVEITKDFVNIIHRQVRIALSSIGINVWEQFWPCTCGWWDDDKLKKPEE